MPTEPQRVTPAHQRTANLIIGAFILGVLAIIGTTIVMLPRGPSAPAKSVVGGPFRLQSSKGGVLDSATLQGKPFLVFFGFTQCPNICPTTLADLGNLLDAFHEEGGDVQGYYITLDPERDTPEVMRAYMSSFSDRLIGLTGTPTEIRQVARSYRATYEKVPLPRGDYTLEHTLMVYMMDRNGRFVGPLDLNAGHALALKQLHALAAARQNS